MKRKIVILIAVIIVSGGSYWLYNMYNFAGGVIEDAQRLNRQANGDTSAIVMSLDSLTEKDSFILTETSLGNINLLDLTDSNIATSLNAEFESYSTKKSIGQQDGPDFNLYMLSKNETDYLFIRMDWNDTLRVSDIWTEHFFVTDIYGISVGSTVEQIVKQRKEVRFAADAHYNIYAHILESRIQYRLMGDFLPLNDTAFTNEKYEVLPWQVEKMEVEYVIWKNYMH